MRHSTVIDTVVELGHVADAARQRADRLAKAPEAAACLGNGDGEQRLAFFADFSAFGHKTQPVEVHVGTAQNRRVGFAACFVFGDVLLDGSYSECAGRLDDAAGIDEHVLDRGADRVGIDGHEFIDQLAADAQRLHAHGLYGGAVGKKPHIGQRHTFFCVYRPHHRVRVVHLHADDLDLGSHRLDVVGHARDQPAAADGDKNRIELTRAERLQLHQNFHRDGALSGNDVRVVERVNKGQAALFFK